MRDTLFGLLSGRAYNVVSTNERDSNDSNNNSNTNRRTVFDFARLFRDRVPRISRPEDVQTRRPRCSFLFMLIGIMAIAVGCFVLVLQPYDLVFRWKLIFAEGGETYEIWRHPPVALYLKIRLFNVTNAEDFMSGKDAKINVQEIGPYVYRENLQHSNVTFNDNGTLTTVPKHPLEWVPELNTGREDDIVTLPNIALLSIANVVKDKSYFARMGLNLLIRQTDSRPLLSMTAREFMFGYKSPLVTLGNKFLSSWIPFDSLGLIDRMYEFSGDYSTVFTGTTKIEHSGLIDTYNGDTDLPHWKGEHCSKVSLASDSTKFPSFIQPNDTLQFYRKSVCRAMTLVRMGEGPVNGLDSYHYGFENNSLDNGIHNERNKCFCRNGKCMQEGLIDVTECYYGFPIAASFPHFYAGDPALQNEVTGLRPDAEKHTSMFKIEPQSGLPLHVSVKFQINMALGDISSISRVERFKGLILPMVWTEISMDHLPDDLNMLFTFYLNVLPVVQQSSIYFMLSAGSVLVVISIARTILRKRAASTASSTPIVNGTVIDVARQRRCSKYLDAGGPRAGTGVSPKEMDLYYSSLLNSKESDIV